MGKRNKQTILRRIERLQARNDLMNARMMEAYGVSYSAAVKFYASVDEKTVIKKQIKKLKKRI